MWDPCNEVVAGPLDPYSLSQLSRQSNPLKTSVGSHYVSALGVSMYLCVKAKVLTRPSVPWPITPCSFWMTPLHTQLQPHWPHSAWNGPLTSTSLLKCHLPSEVILTTYLIYKIIPASTHLPHFLYLALQCPPAQDH